MIRYAVVGAGWISQEAFMPAVALTGNSWMQAIVSGREILRGSSILNVNIWTQHITLVSMQKRSIQTRCCPEKVIGLGI